MQFGISQERLLEADSTLHADNGTHFSTSKQNENGTLYFSFECHHIDLRIMKEFPYPLSFRHHHPNQNIVVARIGMEL